MNKNLLASLVATTALMGVAHAQFPVYNSLPPGTFNNWITMPYDATSTAGAVSLMVMDDLGLVTGGQNATGFSFTTVNANAVGVRVRANFWFWLADATTNAPTGVPNPGTYLLNSTPAVSGFSFTLNLNPGAANVWGTNALAAGLLPLPATGQKLWCGMFYDAVGITTGTYASATTTQLNNLGTIMYQPSIGTSTDTVFSPDDAADTLLGDNNPAGVNFSAVDLGLTVEPSANMALGVRVPGQNITGTVHLNDTVDLMAVFRNVTIKLKQGATEINNIFVTVNPSTGNTSAFTIGAPSGLTGTATLEFDGSPYLKKLVDVNLTGTGATGLVVDLLNGDVNGSGEVDPIDIDLVVSNFGEQFPGSATGLAAADVNDSGEVDPIDIDIVIANFGAQDGY